MTPMYQNNSENIYHRLTPIFFDFFTTQVRCNCLIAGLLFPALQDEDLVICPDWASTELSGVVRKLHSYDFIADYF